MKHKEYREWLQLFVADELNSDQERLLQDHLGQCGECRAELDELQKLVDVFAARKAEEPSDQLLVEAREGLSEAIRTEARRSALAGLPKHTLGSRGVMRGWSAWFGGARFAISGAVAIAVGVLIGYLAFGRGDTPAPVPAPYDLTQVDHALGQPVIANVRFVNTAAQNGEFEVQYDLVRPVRLRTKADDQRMQRVLAHALLNGENPGIRLQAINALESEISRTQDPLVKTALINTLKSDPNVGVRKQSLLVLQGLPFDNDIKKACLYVLANDENPGMRVASINVLSGATLEGYAVAGDVYNVLNATLEEEDEPFLRARSSVFIEEVKNE